LNPQVATPFRHQCATDQLFQKSDHQQTGDHTTVLYPRVHILSGSSCLYDGKVMSKVDIFVARAETLTGQGIGIEIEARAVKNATALFEITVV
jgi:hypothetical protein